MSATELVRRSDVQPFVGVDLSGVQTLAKAMFEAGVFPDVKSAAHAGVKIMAGAELGLGPVASMRSFHIIKGKVEFAAEFLAQRVRQHPHYDYEVLTLENDGCLIAFTRDGKRIGVSSFTDEDRERAGLELETTRDGRTTPTPWTTFPRNMMFARAMSNGVAWYMPDIVAGAPGLIDVVRPFSVLPDDDPDDPTVIEIGKAAADTSSEEPGESGEDGTAGGGPPSPDAAPPAGRRATKAQKSKLIMLANEHGWDGDERHRRAGVKSFNHLTKQSASLLIQAWEADEEPAPAEGSTEGGSEPGDAVETTPPTSAGPDPNAEPTEEFRRRAIRLIGTESAIVVLARKFYPKIGGFESITAGQLARTCEAYMHRNDCGHALANREPSGFCRRCGQDVGEPPL